MPSEDPAGGASVGGSAQLPDDSGTGVDSRSSHSSGSGPPVGPAHASGPGTISRRTWLWTGLALVALALAALVALPRFGSLDATIPGISSPPVVTIAPRCTVSPKLVPSCGVLWGAAAGGFSDTPRDQALKEWEAASGRTATIYHTYHVGDQLFPTTAEIAMSRDTTRPRVLLLNWKVDYGSTFAAVAAGGEDARIDRWAKYVKATYPEKFFLVIHHEPENDVNATVGSGRTAKDFAAMHRHTVQRLRADGLTNAVFVLAYMGNERWMAQTWWKDLYPGDDVVDWIALDSYVNAEAGAYHYGDFLDIIDRAPATATKSQTFYKWATTAHPGKPVMLAEWGVYYTGPDLTAKAAIFSTVLTELAQRPAVRAIVYFDSTDAEGLDISISSTPKALAAFRKIASSSLFNVTIR